jgi:hypothetical protein
MASGGRDYTIVREFPPISISPECAPAVNADNRLAGGAVRCKGGMTACYRAAAAGAAAAPTAGTLPNAPA